VAWLQRRPNQNFSKKCREPQPHSQDSSLITHLRRAAALDLGGCSLPTIPHPEQVLLLEHLHHKFWSWLQPLLQGKILLELQLHFCHRALILHNPILKLAIGLLHQLGINKISITTISRQVVEVAA
jgi:hypothetical protein